MILVKSIEIIETDQDPINIIHRNAPSTPIRVNNGKATALCSEISEMVRGRLFVRGDGTEITIGMTQDAQDVLGIQCEAWDNIQDAYNESQREYREAMRTASMFQLELEELSKTGFFGRLKMLFTGVIAQNVT